MSTRDDNFQLAMVLSLQAELLATQAQVNGMIAENTHREACGNSVAYGEEAFEAKAAELRAISAQFHQLAHSMG